MDKVYQLTAKGKYTTYYDNMVFADASDAIASCERMNNRDDNNGAVWQVITLTVRAARI